MNRQRFQREVQMRNGRPWRIVISPRRTGTNRETEPRIINLVYEMRRAIYQTVRSHNGWTRQRILENVRGFIIAENMLNGENRFYQTSALLSANQLSEIVFEDVIEDIQESNQDVGMYDLSWHFVIDPRTLIAGNGNPKKPDWINSEYADTWENQFFEDLPINCAAYALAHGMQVGKKNKETIKSKAVEIIQKFGWTNDVTPSQIEQFVNTYKEYRVSIVMKRLTTGTITYEGSEFKYYKLTKLSFTRRNKSTK